jgi:hypothetical protein
MVPLAEGLLFPSASGRLIRRSNLQQIWIRAADAAGGPWTHTCGAPPAYGEQGLALDQRRPMVTA